MNNSNELDNILNDCLESLLSKGETVDHCLASYPVQAVYLKPLLETVVVIKRAFKTVQPRPEFRAKARYQLHVVFRERR